MTSYVIIIIINIIIIIINLFSASSSSSSSSSPLLGTADEEGGVKSIPSPSQAVETLCKTLREAPRVNGDGTTVEGGATLHDGTLEQAVVERGRC
jgi:hypothetical protein